jgi:hypothetical protein
MNRYTFKDAVSSRRDALSSDIGADGAEVYDDDEDDEAEGDRCEVEGDDAEDEEDAEEAAKYAAYKKRQRALLGDDFDGDDDEVPVRARRGRREAQLVEGEEDQEEGTEKVGRQAHTTICAQLYVYMNVCASCYVSMYIHMHYMT